MALIVHPHFHRRRTGVTRHEEEVVGALDALSETRALGSALEPRVPRIGWGAVAQAALGESAVFERHYAGCYWFNRSEFAGSPSTDRLLTASVLSHVLRSMPGTGDRHGPERVIGFAGIRTQRHSLASRHRNPCWGPCPLALCVRLGERNPCP